jgi:hypothetical protein
MWNTKTTYTANQLVIGSDSAIYQANTTTQGNNPVGDGGAHWITTAWAGGTTYAQYAYAIGSNGYAYTSLAAGNVGHNPTADAPTIGTQGTYWQNNGPPSQVIQVDPQLASPTGFPYPNFFLAPGSPARGTANQTYNVTSLGGVTISTPNIGAQ